MAVLAEMGFLDIGSQRLEYRFDGPRPHESATLVLLHEGLGCVGLWGDFPARLAAATDMGVFTYSRAGYGQSSGVELPRPAMYMHDEGEKSLPEVLDHLGFVEGVLVGHSDGASIAAIFQGRLRDPRVRGLTLIAPHFFVEELSLQEIARARDAYPELRPKLARWHRDVDMAFLGWSGAWLDPAFRAFDIRPELAHITVPVQVIQGSADQYGTAAQVEAARAGCAGPVEIIMLDGVRHAPHREAPDLAIRAIADFARRVLSGEDALLSDKAGMEMPDGRQR